MPKLQTLWLFFRDLKADKKSSPKDNKTLKGKRAGATILVAPVLFMKRNNTYLYLKNNTKDADIVNILRGFIFTPLCVTIL